jgi:hypothetical protein
VAGMLWGLLHPQTDKFIDPLNVAPDDPTNDLKAPASGMN